MKLKQTICRMSRMTDPAWYIFKRSLQLCLALLCCGLLLTLGDLSSQSGHELKNLAMALYETGEAVLLIGGIFSVVVEAQQSRR